MTVRLVTGSEIEELESRPGDTVEDVLLRARVPPSLAAIYSIDETGDRKPVGGAATVAQFSERVASDAWNSIGSVTVQDFGS